MDVGNNKSSYFQFGFFAGLGSGLATLIFTLVGMLFFIPGLIIVLKQNKKPKEQRNKGLLITGFILMGIGLIVGAIFAIGLFGSALIENI